MFIAVEGIDGVGKTTQARLLADRLRTVGKTVITPREPGGTKIGEKIRDLLLTDHDVEMNMVTEMLMFMAARAELFAQVIQPALDQGHFVVMDRCAWSTFAYQTVSNSIRFGDVKGLMDLCYRGKIPDISFLLDLDVPRAQARSTGKADKIESRGREYFETVRANYIILSRTSPGWRVLNAGQSVETLACLIWDHVEARL